MSVEKEIEGKYHNAKTIATFFVKLVKTQLYSTISQINIHNEQTHYMPVSAVLTFTILLNFHYKIY